MMTEAEFWDFLNQQRTAYPSKMYMAGAQINDMENSQAVDYLTGHALLPKNYDKIPLSRVSEIGQLLFRKNVTSKTKEAVLILLAHIPDKIALTILTKYSNNPDKELQIFSEMALEECEYWNEP
jgi:hypothetical protein